MAEHHQCSRNLAGYWVGGNLRRVLHTVAAQDSAGGNLRPVLHTVAAWDSVDGRLHNSDRNWTIWRLYDTSEEAPRVEENHQENHTNAHLNPILCLLNQNEKALGGAMFPQPFLWECWLNLLLHVA